METSENAVSKSSLKDSGIRLLFVIFFAGVYTVAEFVIAALVVIQFGFKLITGETNEKLQSFSKPLNKYVYAILQFVTFNEDEKPFPFADWPSEQN